MSFSFAFQVCTVYYSTSRIDMQLGSGQFQQVKNVSSKSSPIELRGLVPCETYFIRAQITQPYPGMLSDVHTMESGEGT